MDNKQIVTEFFNAMNAGDIKAIVNSYDEHGVLQTMGRTAISGRYNKTQIEAACAGIYEAFPNGISFTIDNIIAENDKVAVEAHSVGMHSSGKLYSNEYHFLFTIVKGKILELKEYMDTERVTDILCGGKRTLGQAVS
jgi:ketosteroid isomerase-like protein